MNDHNYRSAAIELWSLLDDIDTASDMAKDNDKWYRGRVELLQRKRFDTFTSNGYNLFYKDGAQVDHNEDKGMKELFEYLSFDWLTSWRLWAVIGIAALLYWL